MKKLFHPNSNFVQGIANMGNLLWMNLLWLLCCLPVVTAGASTAALYRMMFNLRDYKSCRTGDFFRAFASNFRKATLCWLLFLLMAGALLMMYTAIGLYQVQAVRVALFGLFALCCIVAAVAGLYMFPLTCYFENTVTGTFLNALLMAMAKPIRALLALGLSLLPLVVLLSVPQIFLHLLVLWVLVAPALLAYGIVCILGPVLESFANQKEETE